MKEIALQAAVAGGKVLLEKFGRTLQIRHKGEVDLVTDADQAAEEMIVNVIRGIFPRHDILAEEGDYGVRKSPYQWIIDPLDGTTNFAHGLPWWTVSIALAVDGEVVLGVVYNPAMGELFIAEKGQGARLNDRRFQVSKTDQLDQALLATGFPYDRKQSPVNNYDHFVAFQQAAQACRRPGAASLDLVYTACGRFDGYWEMKLKPWDIAAGQLIVREAGGRVSDFSDAPLDIHGAEILASNGLLHQAMLEILARGKRP
ncbi:inositol monophosphatase [Geothermobacter hydrogeniphilus]|uniref:Inositol-1-monophosphatase n=1 Tax=Geothermobacter hydrogeniphilus TaxID=1969733 RepID=A0A2K2H7U0_9BACT|nr:inositol monophosphatase family protein [Geothermobacter hydrogeniphilus]PNU19300.1 inositol monophosphatase [Geothermobacter hydrogeniphilus]